MRFTEITHEDRNWSPLVLHPDLTVIWGESGQLAELTEVLEFLYSSAGSAVGGTIEYAGFAMPLDQTSVVSLDIHGSGLRTLDMSLLEQSRSRIRAELDSRIASRLEELDAASKPLTSEAESLRRRQAAASAAMAAVIEEQRHNSDIVDDLAERHESASRRPEELRAEIDAARQSQEVSERTLGAAAELAPSVLEALDPMGASIASLRLGSECPDIIAALAEADSVGLLPAEHAASIGQWLAEVAAGTAEVSQQIAGMLEEIQRLEDEWQVLSSLGVEGDQDVNEARECLDEVSTRTANLEELASSGLLAERARSEIDAAHEAADGAEEHRVLQLYGFDSYLDYTIALSTRSVGEKIEAVVDRARAELVRATDALEMARENAATVLGELNERRDGLRERIAATTGVEPESLSADVLATIPQLPEVLLEVPAAVEASLGSFERELEASREALAGRRAEWDDLADPESIRAEMDTCRARSAELEMLLERAEEVHLRATESLENTESELAKLLAEREELLVERSMLQVNSLETTATEVAVVIRAAAEQVVVADCEPTPVLLADSFSSFGGAAPEVLGAVVASAPGVQFVYLTQDDSMAAWAKKQRSEVGALIRLGRRRWLGRRLAWPQSRQAEDSTNPRSG
jgi:hypothetical protein